MADGPTTTHAHPAEATPGRRFRRGFRGYRTGSVDEAITKLELRIDDLEHEAVELREALLDSQHEASETKHDLTRAKAELRYWNDRASYVDSEVARARQRASEVEQAARERAETIEADAQERSLQLVDRVCSEANAMLQHAREEAREMFLRFETDVDMSQQRLEKLETVRSEVARTMQTALHQFEDAVRELDKVAPARRIVAQLEGPTRRTSPTFGQDRALEAARMFDMEIDQGATASLSSPLDPVTAATPAPTSKDAEPEAPEAWAFQARSPKAHAHAQGASAQPSSPRPRRTATIDTVPDAQYSRTPHEADDEFASLLIQP